MQVKALESPPAPLRWEQQAIVFTVPPGGRLQLFLEGGLKKSLALTMNGESAAGAIRVRERIPLDAVALPRALSVAAGREASWSAGALPAEASGVELAWRGAALRTEPEAVTLPSEVLEQLRALGYQQ
jgi:hypothetical protein